MKTIKQYLVPVLVCFLPVIAGVCVYNELPDMMPTHFNAEGIADGYSSKAFAVFGIPLILCALQVFALFMMNADPKKKNYPRQMVVMTVWIVPVISCLMNGLVILKSLGKDIHIEMAAPVLVGALLVVIGNYLPKVRQNYTMGIKLPWTLESEENWRKTHRLGGFLFVIAGFWMLITPFLKVPWFIVLMPIFVSVIVPVIYSWSIYQKEKNHAED
ncbi:MAG: SdpI family protein [Erysipelotrichaceae bacterium]|nr:SdpI family protein [Erysipelotrichaceae bacterium]